MPDEAQISFPFFLFSDLILKLWSTRSSEDLLYIQHSDVSKRALLRIEHFRALRRNMNCPQLCYIINTSLLLLNYSPERIHAQLTRIITAWAGRLTPQARVAVQKRTWDDQPSLSPSHPFHSPRYARQRILSPSISYLISAIPRDGFRIPIGRTYSVDHSEMTCTEQNLT